MQSVKNGLRLCRDALSDEQGAAALEFAILGPLMLLIMAAITDIGIASVTQMRMNEALAPTVATIVMGGGSLTSATVDSIAGSIGNSLSSADITGTITVTINGGRSYTYQGTQSTSLGSAGYADTCRCPTLVADAVAWGGATDCSSQCADGSAPGKYAMIQYTRPYIPLFSQYGLISSEGIHAKVVARLQ